ncbi:MAG: LLM class flavin-dependent oxidoreductase [Tuberibacillus sp.]
MIRLSVLDQSPIPEGKTAVDALAYTGMLAQETEKLGYYRFWVSEHHFTTSLAGASPEILISNLAAKTSRIRVGSGGVMLPHYSAYKVAENFRVLEGLYPNRIDLGIGRAPGGMPLSTRALQEGHYYQGDPYPQQIDDLVTYLYDLADEHHRFSGIRATPMIETAPQLWLLGSSGGSAMLAARQGAGYAFAHFINGEGGADVVRWYQNRFVPSRINDTPQSMVAIFVVCADTQEEAEVLASSLDLSLLLIEKGGPSQGTPSVETALNYPYADYDRYRIQENRKRMIVGDKDHVKARIEEMSREYQTEEFMVVTITHDFEAKLKSYRLLAEAFGLNKE